MVKMARTPKVVEDRREQIIDAAMRAFSQKGYTRATNKDIAREAGITPGLIYHYFESKEALLKAIIEGRSPLKLVSTLPPQVLKMPSEDFLRFLLPQVLNIVEEEGFVQLLRVIFPELVYNPQIAQIVTGLLHQILGFLTTFFEYRMQVGELRQTDPALAAQVFVGSVFAFVLRRQIIRDPLALGYTQEQMVDAVIETFLRGLEPRE
jgi:AcrR family transcriptional regulator